MSIASASTSLSPPPPPSPGRSTSATATNPSTVTGGGHHRSRPSFTIAYSQPLPASSSSSNPAGTASLSPSASRPPFSSTFNLNPTTPSSQAQPAAPQPSKHFVAPAHPQSHHLHTLPPREKTTRTLILDHTAWLHGRTRFAQARCELGLKVKFKSEEQAAQSSTAENGGTGGRPGLYIAAGSGSASGLGGVNAFGEPAEVELASSDEEGEEGGAKESDGEGVRALGYGRRSRGRQQKLKDAKKKETGAEGKAKDDRMEVDLGVESGSEYSSPGPSYDPSLAPSLAARAIGIEKVLDAMLTQPPSSPPRSPSPPPYALHSAHAQSQHYRAPPPTHTATSAHASVARSKPSRSLPNGVRLRLALLALVNDLFERQPPSGTEESSTSNPTSPVWSQASGPSISTKDDPSSTSGPPNPDRTQSPLGSPPPLPSPSIPPPNTLPRSLATLVQVSSQPFYASALLPSFHTLTLPSSSSGSNAGPTVSSVSGITSGIPSSANAPSAANTRGAADGVPSPTQTRRPPPPLFTWARPSGDPTSPSPLPASPSAATPFGLLSHNKDAERPSASSPTSPSTSRAFGQSTNSARALPTSWTDNTPKQQPAPKTAVGRTRELYSIGCYESPGTSTYRGSSYTQTTTYRSNVTIYGSSSAVTPATATEYPVKKLKTLCPRHLTERCAICTSGTATRGRPSTRIGAGLLKKDKGLLACAVRGDDAERVSGSVLADMIPRFLRLSALVAMELGREASGEEMEGVEVHDEGISDSASVVSTSTVNPVTRNAPRAQPTRAWFALLCGLLTRAVLEGYIARGWKGPEYVEVLMGVGLGIKGVGVRRNATVSVTTTVAAQETRAVDEEDAGEFEPDEMPGVIEASKILFSGLVLDAPAPGTREKATQGAEEEYVADMQERLSEFLTIPHSTPDLATHLVQLSSKYPAEPVERAALRFFEAVAKWRGKPELETYKKSRPLRTSTKSQSSTPAPLPIDALLAPEPPRRPPIDKYFHIPPPSTRKPAPLWQAQTLKRARSATEEERQPKKEKVTVEPEEVKPKIEDGHSEAMQDVDSEWIGPYGV